MIYDELIKRLRECTAEQNGEKTLWCQAADAIEELQKRKHGKWMKAMLDHEAFGVRPTAHYCSECHQIIAFRTFYCPNCGADMRGYSNV